MEKAIELLSKVLDTPADALGEKLGSEEGVTELTNQISSLKVYTDESFNTIVANLKKEQKDSIYNEVKGTTLEMYENDLKATHPELADLKRGVDYKNALELAAKLKNVTVQSDDEQLKKELKTLQDMLNNQKTDYETKLADTISSSDKKLSDMILKLEIDKLKNQLDVDDSRKDGQLELFELAFKQQFELRKSDDGNYIVWNKSTDEMEKNDDFSPAVLDQVVSRVAPSYLQMKDVTPVRGRGSDTNNNPSTGRVNWSKYDNDWNAYYQQELKGKGVGMGSPEAMESYRQFKADTGL